MEAPNSEERRLDLDAPLISTRRSSRPADNNTSPFDSSMRISPIDRRVPFLWERAPGVPKDGARGLDPSKEEVFMFMPPKTPPSRWRPSRDYEGDHVDSCSAVSHDVFSDALDEFSLSESLGVPCRLSGFDGIGSEAFVRRPPSFIMNRFLPAANALAASSIRGVPKYSKPRDPSCARPPQKELTKPLRSRNQSTANATKLIQMHNIACADARSRPPPKACGLMPFLPWSLTCGFKSAVRSRTPRPSNLDAPTPPCKRCSNCGFSSEVDEDGGGWDDQLSIKACKSPGWGLPFLDTSRLGTRRRNAELGKPKGFMVAREMEYCGSGRRLTRTVTAGIVTEHRRPMRRLPQLKPPSEPWLSDALTSINRR